MRTIGDHELKGSFICLYTRDRRLDRKSGEQMWPCRRLDFGQRHLSVFPMSFNGFLATGRSADDFETRLHLVPYVDHRLLQGFKVEQGSPHSTSPGFLM